MLAPRLLLDARHRARRQRGHLAVPRHTALAANALEDGGHGPRTKRTYGSALRLWARFCILFGLTSSLLLYTGIMSDMIMVSYISFMCQSSHSNDDTYAYGSICTYLTAIANLHARQ